MFARISGTGSFIPKRVVTNDDIALHVDTSDEWIVSRTGVRTRHVVGNETAVSMAIAAAKNALADANVQADEIQMIIVATVSAEQSLPCVACEVQAAIGADHAVCFDVNTACTGFITAYQLAVSQMRSGFAEHILLVATESLSHLVDWTDRGTCILFGDGAGATIITANDEPLMEREETTKANTVTEHGETIKANTVKGCDPIVLHADGSRGHVLSCSVGNYIQMDGREVYRFAVSEVPKVIHEILEQQDLRAEDIDYFILHQANQRIIETIAKRLKIGMDRFPCNVDKYGNMSSASIPVLLDEMNRSGKLKRGMKLILAGFGAGLTWGAAYVEW